jgi:hypothetical protein
VALAHGPCTSSRGPCTGPCPKKMLLFGRLSGISFEVRIPMKRPKIFIEFFYVSFQRKIFIFGFNNFILEENKIFMETLLYHQKATEK